MAIRRTHSLQHDATQRLASYFVIEQTGEDGPWGNVFFTNGWRLYIDHTPEPHEWAMKRLGIHHGDVIASGSWSRHGLSFRSPPGVDRGEITEAEYVEILAAIKYVVRSEEENKTHAA